MFCDEALDAVEPIAAGDLTADGRIAEHLTTCPNCASALVRARQLERVLQRRGVPQPSSQFTARTLASLWLRSDPWGAHRDAAESARAFERPGSPTLSRYVGESVSTSNSTEAFSTRGVRCA